MEDSALGGPIQMLITDGVIKSGAGHPRPSGDTISPYVHGWTHCAVGMRMLRAPLSMDCRVLVLLLHCITGYQTLS